MYNLKFELKSVGIKEKNAQTYSLVQLPLTKYINIKFGDREMSSFHFQLMKLLLYSI